MVRTGGIVGTEAFERLPEDKKQKILECCREEFTSKGYANASTNSMIKKIGISKGSLFNYFGTKEELYLDLLHRAGKRMLETLEPRYKSMPSGLLERMERVIDATIAFYLEEPDLYRFFLTLSEPGLDFLRARYVTLFSSRETEQIFFNIFEGVDTREFRYDQETVFTLARWLFAGVKSQMAQELSGQTLPEELKKRFMTKFSLVLEALKTGIFK